MFFSPDKSVNATFQAWLICSCICISLLLGSSVTSPRISVLPLRTEIQIPVSKLGILPSALVDFTGSESGGKFRDVQQDPRLEGLGAIFNFKLITLSVS